MSISPTPNRCLPSKVQRQERHLLNQQCWLWGQDIKRIEGNLLIQYGFERLRPPPGQSGSSQYILHIEEGLHVRLWGFGIYVGSETGVFLNRFEFTPRHATFVQLWQAHEMARLPRAQDFSFVPAVLRWIAGYEHWVLRTCGAEFRKASLLGWEAAVSDPSNISNEWQILTEEVEALLTQRNQETSLVSGAMVSFA